MEPFLDSVPVCDVLQVADDMGLLTTPRSMIQPWSRMILPRGRGNRSRQRKLFRTNESDEIHEQTWHTHARTADSARSNIYDNMPTKVAIILT